MNLLQLLFDAPPSDWLLFAVCLAGIFLFIAAAEAARSRTRWSPEINRKLVHVLTGLCIFASPFFFRSGKPLLWMAVIFIAVDFTGVQTNRLKGIHGTARHSYGTVFYPLAFFILVLACWGHYQSVLMISMLIMALADAAAGIAGESLKHPHTYRLWKDSKSLEGSLTMFVMTFLLVYLILPRISGMDGFQITAVRGAWIALVTACVATALESLSSRGSDNLTVPLGAAFVTHFMLTRPVDAGLQLTIGMVLAGLTAILSFRARFLNASGSVAVFLLAFVIFGAGGWMWSVPILTFFILSSLLSKFGKYHKSRFRDIFEKSGTRDLGQVLANGGPAGLIMLVYTYYPDPVLYWLYLGALAAVNADTWATETGVLSPGMPRSIIGFRPVPHGTSGGISILGTAGGLAGALVIALSGYFMMHGRGPVPEPVWMISVITAAGVLANMMDSVLGALVQAQYQCPACQKITEKKVHCDNRHTILYRGIRWINNDWVNAFCSVSGVFLVWIGHQTFVS